MNIFALTCQELAGEMKRRYGKGHYHAALLYREIFKKGNTSLAGIPELSRSASLAGQLVEDVRLPSCRIAAKIEEGVIKFASTLADSSLIESVLIPARGRTTLCVSSQVGCRMGCTFCTTGGMGFVRSLSTEEIVWQVYAARFILGRQVDNIVFMGMGEPFDNYEHVMQAVRVMSDQRGLDIAPRHITVSTAGHAEGIGRLAASGMQRLRLAVSLNAAEDGLRTALMPINKRYPLARLRDELRAFPLGRDGVIFVEYVLLAGVNDSRDHAMELAYYLGTLPPVRVNVIAFNEGSPAVYRAPQPEQIHRFCRWLGEEKIFVCLRRSRGQAIMAGCGQLGAARPV